MLGHRRSHRTGARRRTAPNPDRARCGDLFCDFPNFNWSIILPIKYSARLRPERLRIRPNRLGDLFPYRTRTAAPNTSIIATQIYTALKCTYDCKIFPAQRKYPAPSLTPFFGNAIAANGFYRRQSNRQKELPATPYLNQSDGHAIEICDNSIDKKQAPWLHQQVEKRKQARTRYSFCSERL